MGADPAVVVPAKALAGLPSGLRNDLLEAFQRIGSNFSQGRWEPAELNGGKLAEAAYSICDGLVTGNMPVRAAKPRNMVDACRALEQRGKGSSRSVQVQIPRMILALYEVRNNRNVGHLGGDVDPNHMDAVCVLQLSKWIVAELVRVLHDLPVDDAVATVDGLVERDVPLVWKIGGQRRVLADGLTLRDQALLLLHGVSGGVAEATLGQWLERTQLGVFRRDVLRPAHAARLLEYDEGAGHVTLSPRGVARVEEAILRPRLAATAAP